MSYYLVISPILKNTLCVKETILYLTKYIKSKSYNYNESEIVPPYGLSISDRKKDYSYTTIMRQKLLLRLAYSLNKFHNKKYSDRYWQIFIGDWLTRYIDNIYKHKKHLITEL